MINLTNYNNEVRKRAKKLQRIVGNPDVIKALAIDMASEIKLQFSPIEESVMIEDVLCPFVESEQVMEEWIKFKLTYITVSERIFTSTRTFEMLIVAILFASQHQQIAFALFPIICQASYIQLTIETMKQAQHIQPFMTDYQFSLMPIITCNNDN